MGSGCMALPWSCRMMGETLNSLTNCSSVLNTLWTTLGASGACATEVGNRGPQAPPLGSHSPSIPQHSPCHAVSPPPTVSPRGKSPTSGAFTAGRRAGIQVFPKRMAGGEDRETLRSLWGGFGPQSPQYQPPLIWHLSSCGNLYLSPEK